MATVMAVGVAVAATVSLVLVQALEDERMTAFLNQVDRIFVQVPLVNAEALNGVAVFLRLLVATAAVQGAPVDEMQIERMANRTTATFPVLGPFGGFEIGGPTDLGFGLSVGNLTLYATGFSAEAATRVGSELYRRFLTSEDQQIEALKEVVSAAQRGNFRPTITPPAPFLMPDGTSRLVVWGFFFSPSLIGLCFIDLDGFLRGAIEQASPGIQVTLYISEDVELSLATSEESEYIFASALEVTNRGLVRIPDLPGGYDQAFQERNQPYHNLTTITVIAEDVERDAGRDQKAYRHLKYLVVATDDFEPYSVVVPVIFGLLCLLPFFLVAALGVRSLRRERALILARAVKMTAAENAKAEAQRSTNEFLAHEVRNPLSVATSANLFLQGRFNDTMTGTRFRKRSHDVANTRRDLRLVDVSLRFINELLANMIDLMQFEAGKIRLKPTVVSIRRHVLLPVYEMLRHSRQGFSIEVVVEPKGDDMWVRADALRLKQVVMNLAKNATKFVLRGFVRLTARRINRFVVRITVEDSGPGIPASKRQDLFARFQSTHDKLNQGTGIGLALCKSVVTTMRGAIELDGSYDSGLPGLPGTRIVVEVPLTKEERPEQERRDVPRISAGATTVRNAREKLLIGRVLIVEDDGTLALLMSRLLKIACHPGVEVEVMHSVDEAIEHLATGEMYDVIFVDHFMPCSQGRSQNGTAVMQFIRKNLGNDSVVLVGCSANDVQEEHDASGADWFMRKPVSLGMLRELRPLLAIPVSHRIMVVGEIGTDEAFAGLYRIFGHPKRISRIDAEGVEWLASSLHPTIVVTPTSASIARIGAVSIGVAPSSNSEETSAEDAARFNVIFSRRDLELVSAGDLALLLSLRSALFPHLMP